MYDLVYVMGDSSIDKLQLFESVATGKLGWSNQVEATTCTHRDISVLVSAELWLYYSETYSTYNVSFHLQCE